MKTLRIAIPYPNHSDITEPCKQSIANLIEASKRGHLPFHLQVKTAQCSRVSLGRNDLINDGKSYKKKQTEFDYDRILFIDADQSFDVDNVIKLWETLETTHAEVISAVTNPRNFLNKFNVGIFGDDGFTTPMDRMINSDIDNKDIVIVDWCGAAFLMIDVSVLRAVEYPWFEERYISIGDEVHSIGEDVMFCHKLKALDIVLLADLNNFVEHHVDTKESDVKANLIKLWKEEIINACTIQILNTEKLMEELCNKMG